MWCFDHCDEFPSISPAGVESDKWSVGFLFKLFAGLPLNITTVNLLHSAATVGPPEQKNRAFEDSRGPCQGRKQAEFMF